MASPELENLWRDPAHWRWPGIYRCPADPRLIVPKRPKWGGWTLNFAQQGAWLVLLVAMVIAVGPTIILVITGNATVLTVLAAVAVSTLVLCLGAAWESNRPR